MTRFDSDNQKMIVNEVFDGRQSITQAQKETNFLTVKG